MIGNQEAPALDELYHCNSKHTPTQLAFVSARGTRQRERVLHALYEEGRARFKTYTGAARIALPRCTVEPEMSVARAIRTRRSRRSFPPSALSLGELGTLLQYGYGAHVQADGAVVRAVPSGGGLYPLDLYVLQTPRAGGELTEGVYHYHAGEHVLQRVRPHCDRGRLRSASIYPEVVASAASVLALVADMPRIRVKYGERAYRLALLEAGHVSQSVYLTAGASGLGAVALDGFYDDAIHALVDLDGVAQIALMLIAIGHRDD
ncbi:MAG TPA: SagB/ThcOx family dehydrogenase [Candidatus Binatia bacterium]|jgi:SagB-type dehydrogenase family enzyme